MLTILPCPGLILASRASLIERIGFVLLVALLPLASGSSRAAETPARPRLLVAEYGNTGNRILEISRSGEITWEHRPPSIVVICEPLPNGHLLYAYGGQPTGVREISRDQKTVWDWQSQCPQVLGATRLANGHILVGEQGPARAVEITSAGTVIRTVPLTTSESHFHRQVRNLHALPNGHILAAHEGEGAVREVRPDGQLVWEYPGVADVFEALRLDNGNTLIACGTQRRIIEVSPAGEIVWEFQSSDAPELNLNWITSLQRLENGNLVVGNFLRGQEGKGAHAFEVRRDKTIVWHYADHSLVKSLTTVRVLPD